MKMVGTQMAFFSIMSILYLACYQPYKVGGKNILYGIVEILYLFTIIFLTGVDTIENIPFLSDSIINNIFKGFIGFGIFLYFIIDIPFQILYQCHRTKEEQLQVQGQYNYNKSSRFRAGVNKVRALTRIQKSQSKYSKQDRTKDRINLSQNQHYNDHRNIDLEMNPTYQTNDDYIYQSPLQRGQNKERVKKQQYNLQEQDNSSQYEGYEDKSQFDVSDRQLTMPSSRHLLNRPQSKKTNKNKDINLSEKNILSPEPKTKVRKSAKQKLQQFDLSQSPTKKQNKDIDANNKNYYNDIGKYHKSQQLTKEKNKNYYDLDSGIKQYKSQQLNPDLNNNNLNIPQNTVQSDNELDSQSSIFDVYGSQNSIQFKKQTSIQLQNEDENKITSQNYLGDSPLRKQNRISLHSPTKKNRPNEHSLDNKQKKSYSLHSLQKHKQNMNVGKQSPTLKQVNKNQKSRSEYYNNNGNIQQQILEEKSIHEQSQNQNQQHKDSQDNNDEYYKNDDIYSPTLSVMKENMQIEDDINLKQYNQHQQQEQKQQIQPIFSNSRESRKSNFLLNQKKKRTMKSQSIFNINLIEQQLNSEQQNGFNNEK